MKSLSCVQLSATLWTVAYQAPPSVGFSRQEYWSGLPFPSPGDLPNPGIKSGSPALQADALPSEPPGKNCTKKDLHDPDNHDGVITHLEPDILECEVKWALGSITMNKASGGDGIPVELFQILKDDAVKVLHSICQQIWKTQQWSQDCKKSVFISIPKKGNAKECSNYCTIALFSHTNKVILKILQVSLQQYMNCELSDVQAGFRKGRGTRDQNANISWIFKKQESSRKTSISALLTMPKPLTVWITINCGQF